MPVRCFALTGTAMMSPPYSSMSTLVVGELLLHPVGVGVGLVDLVDRHDHRHPAARTWSIASFVCGMTPSSAATTMIAMSVDLRAAGTHGGERLVAGRVEEDDPLAVVVDLARRRCAA